MATQFPRDDRGRAVPRDCPDANCGGRLTYDGGGYWVCDGLTHKTLMDDLVECAHSHMDGEKFQGSRDQ
jgi:hypothetical protein